MRVTRIGQSFSIILGLLLTVSSVLSFTANAQSPSLGDVKGFELEQFHQNFSLEKRQVIPELAGRIQAALEREPRLNVVSPADGQIYLTCDGPACREVELTVRMGGPTGPVVYNDDTASYKLFFGSRFLSFERSSQTMAKHLIDRLGDAYEDAKAGL